MIFTYSIANYTPESLAWSAKPRSPSNAIEHTAYYSTTTAVAALAEALLLGNVVPVRLVRRLEQQSLCSCGVSWSEEDCWKSPFSPLLGPTPGGGRCSNRCWSECQCSGLAGHWTTVIVTWWCDMTARYGQYQVYPCHRLSCTRDLRQRSHSNFFFFSLLFRVEQRRMRAQHNV